MDTLKINQILQDTAYIRTGGSREELRCAEYIAKCCADLGLQATIEPFAVPMSTMQEASLEVDGKQIPCKGYLCSGNAELEAPLYYLTSSDAYSLSQVKDKIVLVDGGMGYWLYHDLLNNGCLGFITYDGNVSFADCDMDQKELRSYVHQGKRMPGVNINAKDAVQLVNSGASTAKIKLNQEEFEGESRNVILDLPGLSEDTIVFTAHYDSTSLSQGAYDNMSGSIGLLAIAEYFATRPHRCSLRFIWCGSEERGLLGAKAYCAAHEEELKNVVMNINLDMIGCIMGKFIACCTSEDKLVHYLQYLSMEKGRGIKAYQDVYSSDSTPFADKGVPAVSFARLAPPNTATIHNRYDTLAVMKAEHLLEDVEFILSFADRMANAAHCPVAKEMPQNMKDKLDIYLLRKRDTK
jgi:hypothetical protein